MTTIINKGFVLFSATVFLYACGTTRTAADKDKLAAEIARAVGVAHFTFKATYAYPTGYPSIYLSPFLDVKVNPVTLKAYLPYYRRAYSAPKDPREGGYRFTSTD